VTPLPCRDFWGRPAESESRWAEALRESDICPGDSRSRPCKLMHWQRLGLGGFLVTGRLLDSEVLPVSPRNLQTRLGNQTRIRHCLAGIPWDGSEWEEALEKSDICPGDSRFSPGHATRVTVRVKLLVLLSTQAPSRPRESGEGHDPGSLRTRNQVCLYLLRTGWTALDARVAAFSFSHRAESESEPGVGHWRRWLYDQASSSCNLNHDHQASRLTR
jgi:hypothetical protein